jgi:regulator of sigma E protease
MAIISAGVIMNVILAVICFVVVFQGPGKDRKAGVVGMLDTDGPAWRLGLSSGEVLRDIGGIENPYFDDLMVTVMATSKGDQLRIVSQKPGGTEKVIWIEPRLGPSDVKPMLGLAPLSRTQLEMGRYLPKVFPSPTWFGSAAARAEPPFAFGDRIVATSDPKDPAKVTELRDDPRHPGAGQRDYLELVSRLRLLADREIVIRVERTGADGRPQLKDIKIPPAYHLTLGARMEMGYITGVRKGSPGEKAGIQAAELKQAAPPRGDIILAVEVQEPDGSTTRYGPPPQKGAAKPASRTHPLDPARLPSQLRDWAQRMADAGQAGKRKVSLHVGRPNGQAGGLEKREPLVLGLEWDEDYEDNLEVPMSMDSPLSIPGLGIAYRIKRTVADVTAPPPGAVRSGPRTALARAWLAVDEALGVSSLRRGDVIKKVRYAEMVNDKGESEDSRWQELKKLDKDYPEWAADQWARVAYLLHRSQGITRVDLEVERDGKPVSLTIYPWEDRTWPLKERGLILATDTRVQKASGFVDAIGLGLKDTKNKMIEVFQNLRGMIVGRISVENLGGPITIGRVAYYFAGLDFWEFVFFLGLISVNLAVINFLPIPVLDGGHMVFLVYEKLRGKPASEGVRVGATYAGLLLLASLMIFVLFLDIKRLL